MKTLRILSVICSLVLIQAVHAATITVNTADNTDFSVGVTNLVRAITNANDGDTIAFAIPGAGPHYLLTPPGGYPVINKNNLTIDGYSQPSAVPNTNPILSNNNAQIKIVLSSTNGNFTSMDYNNSTNSGAGYGPEQAAILGVFQATNVHIQGLCLLADNAPAHGTTDRFGIAFARDRNYPSIGHHVSGCWIGVDLDGSSATNVYGDNIWGGESGVDCARHRQEGSYTIRWTTNDGVMTITNTSIKPNPDLVNRESYPEFLAEFTATNSNPILSTAVSLVNSVAHSNIVIGVKPGSANPRAEFNVVAGFTHGILLEGQAFKVSGNFLGVLPSGTNDYILCLEQGRLHESQIEIGRGASDIVIGTDGDGVNDADERNIMGGVVTDGSNGSFNYNGYDHVIEFYSSSSSPGDDRKRIRIAGNYIGVGVDGTTRFTNGVPMVNGSTSGASQYWIGTDFDGVSDDLEANVVYNNYPAGFFYATAYTNSAGSALGFFDQPGNSALFALRGNVAVNNYPFPVNPGRDAGTFITNYMAKVLVDTTSGIKPTLSTSSSTARLRGTAPIAKLPYEWTILDVYRPDPEGLVNGLVVPDPNLPNGWVQGLKYLRSYVVAQTNLNVSPNLSTVPGEFELDICALGLTNGTQLTVAANYTTSAPGTHNPTLLTSPFAEPVAITNNVIAITSVSESGGTLTICWCGGGPTYSLERTCTLSPPSWSVIASGLSGPCTTDTITGPDCYYRISSP